MMTIDKRVHRTFKIKFNYLLEDWRILRDIIGWSDSYVRFGQLLLEINKNGVTYSIYFERNKDLMAYFSKITISCSYYIFKGEESIDKENEILDFIKKKFKKANPEFSKIEIQEESEKAKLK